MRQAKSGPGWGERALIGLVALAVSVPAAWADINGGHYHTTLGEYEKGLKAGGWGVSCGVPRSADSPPRDVAPGLPAYSSSRGVYCVCSGHTREVALGVPAGSPDDPEYRGWVNRLVARALESLPKKEAAKVPADAKRQVARRAGEAIWAAVAGGKEVIKEGRAGSLRYRVGAYQFHAYWEEVKSHGRKRVTRARRDGLVPFVAVKVEGAKGRAGE